ncbi:uroporphyrinogen-III synthase [Thiogranum longum]|uniref:Uroporphyrinogen-III synthase n=1 Tax=Thiogranum longum TaxID=1537524 RepID=A0A4R1H531_9GAMM|nr:uroporphyrinogen-III synthase [Thiogranum longum]TCK16814.1 uroporphyrinogen-III synthase [Thiogranum longum]
MTEPPATGSGPLRNCGVLVTRPAHQASGLCQRIGLLGGRSISFPVLEITAPKDSRPLEDSVAQLDDFDIAIFISANAVEHALACILAQRDWPVAVRIAVIGRRSAEALESFGLQADICPQEHFNSEGLLEQEALQDVAGQQVLIFRGNGGREYLADSLRERGATVQYVEAYQRSRPAESSTSLVKAWRSGKIDIVQVNSIESLENLFAMLDDEGRALLRDTPLLVVSERMLPVVERMGFTQPPVLAANATDDAVLDALCTWHG